MTKDLHTMIRKQFAEDSLLFPRCRPARVRAVTTRRAATTNVFSPPRHEGGARRTHLKTGIPDNYAGA